MSDLVERLYGYRYFRRLAEDGSPIMCHPAIADEAAVEIERLRELWLTEQRIRLEQAEFLEMYSAAKAKVKIERLRAALQAIVDFTPGSYEAMLARQTLQAAQAAGGDDECKGRSVDTVG